MLSASIAVLTLSIPGTQLIFLEMTDGSLARWKNAAEYNRA